MATDDGNVAADAPYSLPNVGEQAPQRFSALAALYDPATIDYLERCGVTTG
jgi:hypothetical protein